MQKKLMTMLAITSISFAMASVANASKCSLQKPPTSGSPSCNKCLEEVEDNYRQILDEREEARDEARDTIRQYIDRVLMGGQTNWGVSEYKAQEHFCGNKYGREYHQEDCMKLGKLIGLNKLANATLQQKDEWEKVCQKK